METPILIGSSAAMTGAAFTPSSEAAIAALRITLVIFFFMFFLLKRMKRKVVYPDLFCPFKNKSVSCTVPLPFILVNL